MATTRYAFFDVDETLIGIKSMFSFRDFYLRWTLGAEREPPRNGRRGNVCETKSLGAWTGRKSIVCSGRVSVGSSRLMCGMRPTSGTGKPA